MKQNLTTLDKILRFALAFWWLGPFAPQFNFIWLNWIIAAIAWIALLESFLGFCWLHSKLGITSKH